MAEVFAAFGQPVQNRALVFGADCAQILLAEGSAGNGERIGRVTLPATTHVADPDFHGKCRGEIGNGDLGNSAAQAVGAFGSESAVRPLRGPAQQLLGSPALTTKRRTVS